MLSRGFQVNNSSVTYASNFWKVLFESRKRALESSLYSVLSSPIFLVGIMLIVMVVTIASNNLVTGIRVLLFLLGSVLTIVLVSEAIRLVAYSARILEVRRIMKRGGPQSFR